MLLLMDSGALLRSVRTNAGLSRRGLAAKAGVPTSTVSRIESSQSDPTLTMLDRLVQAAECTLVVEARPREDRFTLAELATAYDETDSRLRIDWTRLRAFVDHVEQHPDDLQEAIADPPASTVALLNAILAALAEQLADEHGIERPRWTRTCGWLPQEWSPPSTPRMRKRHAETTPEAFRRRNLILARSALFRSPPPRHG